MSSKSRLPVHCVHAVESTVYHVPWACWTSFRCHATLGGHRLAPTQAGPGRDEKRYLFPHHRSVSSAVPPLPSTRFPLGTHCTRYRICTTARTPAPPAPGLALAMCWAAILAAWCTATMQWHSLPLPAAHPSTPGTHPHLCWHTPTPTQPTSLPGHPRSLFSLGLLAHCCYSMDYSYKHLRTHARPIRSSFLFITYTLPPSPRTLARPTSLRLDFQTSSVYVVCLRRPLAVYDSIPSFVHGPGPRPVILRRRPRFPPLVPAVRRSVLKVGLRFTLVARLDSNLTRHETEP